MDNPAGCGSGCHIHQQLQLLRLVEGVGMIKLLQRWYIHEYQSIVYAIGVFKAEVEKFFAFISPILSLSTFLKVYYDVPKSTPLFLFVVVTPLAYYFGKILITLGVPKKTAQLGNMQNPELMRLIEQNEEIIQKLKNGR